MKSESCTHTAKQAGRQATTGNYLNMNEHDGTIETTTTTTKTAKTAKKFDKKTFCMWNTNMFFSLSLSLFDFHCVYFSQKLRKNKNLFAFVAFCVEKKGEFNF